MAVLVITKRIVELLPGTEDNWFSLSEYVYTLGKIDPPLKEDSEKLALLDDAADLQKLYDRSFWTQLKDVPAAPDPFERIPTYLHALIVRLKSKGLATAP